MIKRLCLIVFILAVFKVESQNWDSIRGGRPSGAIEALFFDSIHNELIVSSKFMDKIGALHVRGVARWNGTRWDSLTGGINTHDIQWNPNSPGGTIYDGIPYNGKLLVGGGFSSIGGINATSLALWDGVKWDSLPKRAFPFSSPALIQNLFKKGNLIYICGMFSSVAGQSCNGLATWDGVNFACVSTFSFNSTGRIWDIIEYNNELYICGGYFYNPPTYYDNSDVLKFDGAKWVSMIPSGLKGFYTEAVTMAVYNNELYLGGHFLASDGNMANNIMKWDGSQWHDVGFGGENVGDVRKLLVHNNKLWAIGCYGTAAHMPAFSISSYDGVKWCSLQDTLDNCLGPAAIYNDTMYVGGGFWTAGGDSNITYLAKLKNENLIRNCNGVGITEFEKENTIRIYPNPVSNTFHIESEQYFEAGTEIEITNTLGQAVLKRSFIKEIDLSSLVSGYYTLKVISLDKPPLVSKFIKQ